jgi:single-stranded DNA-binding protein
MVRAMGIEATGKLHTIYDTKQVSERFSKREFVLELTDNPKYPQVVLFQLTGDRCAQLDGLQVGDMVRIDFSLRGREWRSPQGEVKYFNSLDVWKVEPASERRRDARGRGDGDRESAGGGGGGYGSGGYGRRGGGGDAPPRDDAPPRNDEPRPSELGMGGDDDLPF